MAIPYEGEMSVGQWDFDGACAPREDGSDFRTCAEHFTLGIFQVEAKTRGKLLKRGKVQLRVQGKSLNPAPAYALARKICRALNQGKYDVAEYGKTVKAY